MMIYCPRTNEAGRPCKQPLGILLPGEFGRQVSTLEGVRVTSKEGGFWIHCPACGAGYFWHQTQVVEVEEVAQLLQMARLLNWKTIKFSGKGRRKRKVDTLA